MSNEGDIVETEFGFAMVSAKPPHRKDLFWKQKCSGHIYAWDEDGWHRLQPPERVPMKEKDLPHG